MASYHSLKGQCGCGTSDVDLNGDGLLDCFDDPNATPPPPEVPEASEEVASLAEDAKYIVKAIKGKKPDEAIAVLRENMAAIKAAMSSGLTNGVLEDKKQQ